MNFKALRIGSLAVALSVVSAAYSQGFVTIYPPVRDPAVGPNFELVDSTIFEIDEPRMRATVTSKVYRELGVDGLIFSYSIANQPVNSLPAIIEFTVVGAPTPGNSFVSPAYGKVITDSWQSLPQLHQLSGNYNFQQPFPTQVDVGTELFAQFGTPAIGGLYPGDETATLFIRTMSSSYIATHGVLGNSEINAHFDTFAPVPEPGTMLAIGAGAAFLAARRRRKA